MRRALALAALTACAGCVGSEDVLAWESPSSAYNPFDAGCSGAANGVALLSKIGHLYLMQPDTGQIDDRGTPECLSSSYIVSAASIDRAGMIWVAFGAYTNLIRIDPITLECELLDVSIGADAMAFVYDPDSDTETLYALQGRELVAIDTETSSLVRMGSIGEPPKDASTDSLVGTSGNHLFMLTSADDVSIASVDVTNAKLMPRWNARLPGDYALLGGAAWGSDFLFGSSKGMQTLWTASQRTTPVVAKDFPATDARIVAASTCTSAL